MSDKWEMGGIWVNREKPTGRWFKQVHAEKWHERLRFWLVRLLIKSMVSDVLITTGTSSDENKVSVNWK